MKIPKSLLVVPAMVAVQTVFAQEQHLKLSDEFPAAGEKIILTYDPTGTVTDDKKDITGTVYYLDNKNYPADDIDLKPDGKLLKGEININPSAKAFIIKIMAGEGVVDNNNDKGYLFLVYKDKQPVEGAYASEAHLRSGSITGYYTKTKTDLNASVELYKKEFALYPSSEKEYGTSYYNLLARSPEYKSTVDKRINDLEKSSDEVDLRIALSLLNATKQIKRSDSLTTAIKTKFPNGSFVKDDLFMSIYKEKNLTKKDSLFKIYLTKHPENTKDDQTSTDNLRYLIASEYLRNHDIDTYKKYASQIKDKSMLAGSLNSVAWDWAVAGDHLSDAEKLAKESVDILSEKINNPGTAPYITPKQSKRDAQGSYNASADTYAYILWKENKSAEALPYMKAVYDLTSNEENSTEHYAQILAGVGQYDKALDIISKGMKAGQTSEVLNAELKKDYIKVKGSDAGFDKYFASLQRASKEKIMTDLAKTMINQPAPAFTLKDLDGKAVSLAELKGKTVIIDFWATWCGPCKASFPGMQLAVNKYKDDPNVKFLFVDTWENGDNYVGGVKKFITDNKYTFHVLIDEKIAGGKQGKLAADYEVGGIPTKFIIDKNGNIRFKYVGYSGSADKILDEVTNMIDMAQNPDAVAVVPNNSGGKSK